MSDLASGTPLDKLSKNETLKAESQGLLGPIADELANPAVPFTEDSVQLLKHHGTYQQDNRDERAARRKAGLDKHYIMMVRTKSPGGLLTPEQYLLCDDLADKYGQHDLRITSRQGFQFHGVVKGNLRSLIHDLNLLQKLTTAGACGDVVRNTMASSVADIDPRYAASGVDVIALASEISRRTLPQSTSYFDLWLNDEKVRVSPDGEVTFTEKPPSAEPKEPLYGKQYLPRKFKIGITLDFDNSIDIYTQDIGIIGVTDKAGKVTGWEVLVGGGLGHSHSKPETYARLGSHLTFIPVDRLIEVVEALVKVQRDHGNREQRHQARFKYTVDRLGIEEVRRHAEAHCGFKLPPALNHKPLDQPDYLGWHEQAQSGLVWVGAWVENGRVRDFEGGARFRTGLRRVVEQFKPSVRLTAHHNVVFANIRAEDRAAVQAILDEHGIPVDSNIEPLRRHEMACPALPLCGLALAEAERELPRIMKSLIDLGHADDDVVIRMTGCPNSCARPETAEIGIIGRGPNKFNLYAGGDKLGTRMNTLVHENATTDQVAPLLSKLFGAWHADRAKGQDFGDWAHERGVDALKEILANGG